jgi:hypothetical protein
VQNLIYYIYSQLHNIHEYLVSPPKRAVDLESVLALVAQKRVHLNALVSEINGGLGPVVAASVVTLCLRLSFSLFTNFSMAAAIFSGKMPSLSTILILYPRTFLKSLVLILLAHSGQNLADEVCFNYKRHKNEILMVLYTGVRQQEVSYYWTVLLRLQMATCHQ